MKRRRLIVAGGHGFFGSDIVSLLRELGHEPIPASRRSTAGMPLDVEQRESLQDNLLKDDIVVDAVGPFHARSTTLLNAAIDIGFDLIDISDNLDYAIGMYDARERIEASGIGVWTSCSAVSTISALAVETSGISDIRRVSAFLAPASRDTANPATIHSLLHGIVNGARLLENGVIRRRLAWDVVRQPQAGSFMPSARFRLVESADAVILPSLYPGVKDVDFHATTNLPGADRALALGKQFPALLASLARRGALLTVPGRWFGSLSGGYAVEIEGDNRVALIAFTAQRESYRLATIPAVLAASTLATGGVEERGLVPASRHVDRQRLLAMLEQHRFVISSSSNRLAR